VKDRGLSHRACLAHRRIPQPAAKAFLMIHQIPMWHRGLKCSTLLARARAERLRTPSKRHRTMADGVNHGKTRINQPPHHPEKCPVRQRPAAHGFSVDRRCGSSQYPHDTASEACAPDGRVDKRVRKAGCHPNAGPFTGNLPTDKWLRPYTSACLLR
jgi:hypothetical protein